MAEVIDLAVFHAPSAVVDDGRVMIADADRPEPHVLEQLDRPRRGDRSRVRRRAELTEAIVAEAEQRIRGLDEEVTGTGLQRHGRRLELRCDWLVARESIGERCVEVQCPTAVECDETLAADAERGVCGGRRGVAAE